MFKYISKLLFLLNFFYSIPTQICIFQHHINVKEPLRKHVTVLELYTCI